MNDRESSTYLSAAERSLKSVDLTHDVIVLPHEFSPSDVALYDDSALDLVKVLRGDGVDAIFAHETSCRSWIGKKSAELLISFIVGIASSGGWAGIAALFRRHKDRRINAKIARIVRSGNQTTWQWIELSGTGQEIADLIDERRWSQIDSNEKEEQ